MKNKYTSILYKLALFAVSVIFINTPINAQVTVIDGNSETYKSGPMHNYYDYGMYQNIYLQSEIGVGGNITALQWEWDNSVDWTFQIDVYMGHTRLEAFDGSYLDYVPNTELQLVYSGPFDVFNNSDWVELRLNVPFAYNNTDNLVIYIDNNTGSYYPNAYKRFKSYGTMMNYRSMGFRQDTFDPGDVNLQIYNFRDDNVPSLKLTIESTGYTWVGGSGGGDDVSWNDGNNWDSGIAPTSGDDVIISSSYPAVIQFGGDCKNLTVESGAVFTIADPTATITVAGNYLDESGLTDMLGKLDITGTFECTKGILSIPAGGEIEVDGASTVGTTFGNSLNLTGGTFDANGTFDATGTTINMDASSNIELGGTVTSLGLLDYGEGTVTYDAAATQTIKNDYYYNLIVDFDNGSYTKSLDGTTYAFGDFTVNASTGMGHFDVSTRTIIVYGQSDINEMMTVSTGTFMADGPYDATGSSVIFSGAGLLQLGGTVTSLGTFTKSTSTVEYYSGSTTLLIEEDYYNLEIDGSCLTAVSFGGTTVENELKINTGSKLASIGTLSPTSIDIDGTLAMAGTMTVSGTSDIDGTLAIGATTFNADGAFDATSGDVEFTGAGTLALSSTVTDLGTFTKYTGSTVTYDGASSQTVDNVNYENLNIEGASTKTAGGALDVDGNLTTANTASCILDLAAYDLNLAGDLTVGYEGGLDASDASCAVTFDGTTSTVTHAGSQGNVLTGGQTLLSESYSNLSNWTETHVDGSASWSASSPGGSTTFSAYSGSTCAWIQENSYTYSSDYIYYDLPSPQTNMSISYYYINPSWVGDIDQLLVEYYATGVWINLATYTSEASSWTQGYHSIPDGATMVRFYSNLNYGYGIGVDDVEISGDGYVASSINPTFKDVTINGADVTLADKMDITGTLTLTSGDIISDATNKLTIKDGGTVSGASASSHVVGPMDIETSTTGDYDVPIGDGTRYRPLIISPEEAVATSYTAEFKPTAPSSSDCGSGVDHVAPGSWWDVDRGAEDVDCYMTIAWDATSGVDAYQDLLVTHYSSATSKWENHPGTIAGDNTGGTIKTNDPFSDFSPFNLGSSGGGNTLPIDLLSFTADCSHDLVDVNFTVVSQVNNDYFMIERSEDAINWEEIGMLDGAGTNNTQMDYSFVDTDPLSGLAYYRLTQVDFNEKGKTFSPVSASCQGTTTSMPMDVYPNPAVDHFTMEIDLEAYQGNDVYYTLLDANGAIVQQQHIDLDKGINKQVFDVRGLPNGVYFLRFINTRDQISEKRIVIK